MRKVSIFLLVLLPLLYVIILQSCATPNKTVQLQKRITPCDTTLHKLNFVSNSQEENWVLSHIEECNRINEFFKMFGYSDDSIEYMRQFVKMKLEDDEFKLERFIELYCLLYQNPNALIDGTLDKKKEK